ncbi:hypothetical protein ABB37_01364 [Leptomonas pyrrhocoris]|uniref:Trypanosoma Tc-38 (p38) protein domain-containing protein n=1 Tax=Leptomonas pyrrhocoris TaxID=157538 RepID=A0A0N0DZ58_LEPPY|nr:hypothetical protein ABB37_01364 [Leptomonas pyrrhocoris]KPA84912.1 hypothetical protein ABB37_01364 [Leptomonas pyrrhocoris]|eukprot:XP_015663351.1 hypothetical protein ABB37_01364 [Leptomonas pyrrhocoris]
MKRAFVLLARPFQLIRPAKINPSQRKVPISAQNEASMLATVTNTPFSKRCQVTLREVARRNHYMSRYWVTQPQSSRSCNAVVLPGQKPAVIYLHVEKVIPLTSLTKKDQKRILEEHPPFFGSGVGILSERKKWKAVTAERLIRLLNAAEEERALFIDLNMATELELAYDKKAVIDVRPASSVNVYNAQQLDDAYKGEPQKGVALNATTGKRFGQPAHDILLGVGILRGYTSPMWIGESQMKYLNVELKRHAYHQAVAVPDMTGMVVSLSFVPPKARAQLLQELKKTRPDAFGHDTFFIYGVNGWEAMRSRMLVKYMAAVNDPQYPFHFVNLKFLRVQKPEFAAWVSRITKHTSPIGPSLLTRTVDEKTTVEQQESRIAVQGTRRRYFFADDATLRRYYNAACMKTPHLMMPSVRPIAILNGKLIGPRDESLLRAFALKHKLSSPIWLTESAAARLGIGINPTHKQHFVTIGAAAAETNPEEEIADGFYNIGDFARPEEILSLFPKTSKKVHFMLDTKWRPVLGKQRQDYLCSLKRDEPLWVSVNECLMSGFEPKPGASLISFPSGRKKGTSGTRVYNSQYTTDPVRAIGLSPVYTRPQGLTV